MNLVLLQVCCIHCRTKLTDGKPRIPRYKGERKKLSRKRKKLENKLNNLTSLQPEGVTTPQMKKVTDELNIIHLKIRDSVVSQLQQKEDIAIKKLKDNPKYFFSYAKQFSKTRAKVNLLHWQRWQHGSGRLQDGRYLSESVLYRSVFSDPNSTTTKEPSFTVPTLKFPLTDEDLHFTQEDIVKTIKEIDESSACGPDDIPAIVLKRCCNAISEPILYIWEQSFDTAIIPQLHKEQLITPVHKKGSRAKPEEYRPKNKSYEGHYCWFSGEKPHHMG